MAANFCSFILRFLGWQVKGFNPNNLPKAIVIVVPHTSNWDFPLGLLVRCAWKMDIRFIAKSSLFKPPFGWLFKWLGGYPVERSRSTNFVQMMVGIYRKEHRFHTVIAPEGTRSRVDKLKTGFYHIALGSGAAIIMCRFDWGRKVVEFREPFYATGDLDADMAVIDNYFRGIQGKNPEQGYLYKG